MLDVIDEELGIDHGEDDVTFALCECVFYNTSANQSVVDVNLKLQHQASQPSR